MVNVAEPDLRLNRLLLLGRIRSSLEQVADFSLIEDAAARGAWIRPASGVRGLRQQLGMSNGSR